MEGTSRLQYAVSVEGGLLQQTLNTEATVGNPY